MKNIKSIIAAAIAVSILFSACSVEKRRYRKGYNVETKSKKPKAENTDTKLVNSEPPTTTTTATPTTVIPATTTTTAPAGVNNNYTFTVKVGPRPDKKKVQAKHKPK